MNTKCKNLQLIIIKFMQPNPETQYQFPTNTSLIDYLYYQKIIKSKIVYYTMLSIDYKYFIPQPPFYINKASKLGYGSIISAPHMHAYALQYMVDSIRTAKNVLDVGVGSGYMLLAMDVIAGRGCKVWGIQHVPELVQQALNNIMKANPEILGRVHIKCGDGRKGWNQEKHNKDKINKQLKFDVIHVGASCEQIPMNLFDQLQENGMMIIPIGKERSAQIYKKVQKNKGKLIETALQYVCYVPLTDIEYQKIR